MKELIVGGKDDITYIITANGKKRQVKKGDKVQFKDHEEAKKALNEVKTFQGENLFYLYEKVKKNKEELSNDGENSQNG